MDDNGQVDGAIVYHAGTKYENGKFYTNGGRVLGVTATADTLDEALDKAYSAVSKSALRVCTSARTSEKPNKSNAFYKHKDTPCSVFEYGVL